MRKLFKIVLYIVGGLLLLLFGAVLFLISPPGKRFVRDKALVFLRGKLKTEINIGEVVYSLPKMVGLKDVLIKDQQNDTLLSAHLLKVDIDLLKLLNNKVSVNDLVLENVHANVYRNKPDTNFNFTYIIDAFASKDTTAQPKDTNASPFVFDVGTVRLQDIHIRFKDQTGGIDLETDLESLRLRMRELDPSKMIFRLKSLAVKGLNTRFRQDTSLLVSTDTSAPKPITLAADELSLQDIRFAFESVLTRFYFDIAMNRFDAHPKEIDLQKRVIDIRDLSLAGTQSRIRIGRHSEVPEQVEAVADSADEQNWTVRLGNLKLSQIDFAMDNDNMPVQREGIDYAHLGISALSLQAIDVRYAQDIIGGNIQHFTVREKSGLVLQELRTRFSYTDTAALLNDLYLKTDHTVLQDHLEAHYPSIAALSKNIGLLWLDVRLKHSVIGMPDVFLFAPQLRNQQQLRPYANASLDLEALLKGKMDRLAIARLYLKGLKQTEVDLSGQLNGLPDTNKINYALEIKTLRSGSADLIPFMPEKARTAVRIPDAFSLTGNIAGTLKEFRPAMQLNSTDGAASVKGMLAIYPGREKYDLDVHTSALNIGRIIRKDTLLGPITAQLSVKGSSFDLKRMTASIQGSVQSAFVKGYAYRDIRFDGSMAARQAQFNLESADPNARLRLNGSADLSGQYAAALADLVIDSIDLQALKLYKDPMRIQAVVHADIPALNPEYPDGIVSVRKPVIAANGKVYALDSIYVSSRPNADSGQNIRANLDFMQAAITGKIPLAAIPAAVQEHINRHYKMRRQPDSAVAQTKSPVALNDTATVPIPAQYNLTVWAQLYKSPFLEAFLPQLTRMDTVKIDAVMNESGMDARATARQIVYGANNLQGFSVNVQERDSGLYYNAGVERLTQNKLQLINTRAEGRVDANLITVQLSADDERGKQRFGLGASLQQEGNAQVLSIGEGLMLNYQNWSVAQPNRVAFGPEGFYVQNVALSGNGASIAVNSDQPVFNAPLTAKIDNFRISDIMELVSGDTLFADGVLAGTAQVRQMKPAPLVDADFSITNFSVLQDTIGAIQLKAANTDANTINATLAISGNGNDVQVKGNYYTQPVNSDNFNFDVMMNALNLRSFEGLAQKQIRNSSGFVRGKINARGTFDKPVLNGLLQTDNLQTNIAALNATFKMPEEKILFDASGIRFDRFRILDSANNEASIDGRIATGDFKNMMLDLNVRAKNWKALSSSKADNKVFFGKLTLSTNLNINGSLSKPSVNGSLNILKGTDVTVVLPDRNLSLEDQAGIVVFVDKSDTGGRLKALPPKDTALLAKVAPGSEINVNITTDEEASFNVIIDQATGDFLSVRGKASLNTAIDAGGSLTLNGIYELYSGAYQLNYNLIRRKFDIQKGSTITFAGDPLQAEMNVTAVYKANVAPYDLVERQVPDASQLVYYRQALPFNVQLKMNGPLLVPQLSFDIVLPENTTYRISSEAVQLVQARLSQLRVDTSELNKQVFALLLLKRFITDDPLNSGSGTTAEFAAKQSVSRFLGEQLNQFANQLVNGFDLSVDLASTEDYTTGERRERTDLNVAASKRLFNDRLKVTIGNNFELEGPQTKSTDPNSSLIPGNLAVDYSLTADNRYMMRAYRQSLDQGVIQGYVTETGVNFIVSYDYNRFRNLFVRKKVLEMRRKQRQLQTNDNK